MYRATSTRQTRSLDNIAENPDRWRFNNRTSNFNAHLKFINEAKNSASDMATSNSDLIER